MKRLLVTIILAGVTGCESKWQSAYRPSGPQASPLPPRTHVLLREVPWERLQAILQTLQDERIASDVHPDEWPADRRNAAHAELLRGLQISADPRTVRVLGRSEFRTTWPTRPDDGDLERFARSIGATMVAWSSTYLGKTLTTRQEPVTGYSTGSHPRRDHHGRWRSDSFSEHSTIWVPVTVEADEHAWVAYFLREDTANEANADP